MFSSSSTKQQSTPDRGMRMSNAGAEGSIDFDSCSDVDACNKGHNSSSKVRGAKPSRNSNNPTKRKTTLKAKLYATKTATEGIPKSAQREGHAQDIHVCPTITQIEGALEMQKKRILGTNNLGSAPPPLCSFRDTNPMGVEANKLGVLADIACRHREKCTHDESYTTPMQGPCLARKPGPGIIYEWLTNQPPRPTLNQVANPTTMMHLRINEIYAMSSAMLNKIQGLEQGFVTLAGQLIALQQQIGQKKHVEVSAHKEGGPSTPKPSLSGILAVSEQIHNKTTPNSGTRKKRKLPMTATRLDFGDEENMTVVTVETFDPTEVADYFEIKAFEQWYQQVDVWGIPAKLMLPMKMVGEVPQRWFINLWDIEGWLSNEHCDALINLIIMKAQRVPRWFDSGWTCIEALGWNALSSPNIEAVKDRIMPYVEGRYPEIGGLAWHEAAKIYGIGHVNNNHWVLYAVSIPDQEIIVYDSLSKNLKWESVEETFNVVRLNMQWLCEVGGVWNKMKHKVVKRSVWGLTRYEHPPQQVNESDCGVMALKYLECLVSGWSLRLLQPEKCPQYRRSYCADLYQLRVQLP